MTDEMSGDDAITQLATDFRRFLQLYRALNTPDLRDQLEKVLDDTRRRIAYQLTEPDRPSTHISEAMEELGHETPASTIRVWQQKWIREGLVRKVSARKRQRVFDLEEFGIDIGADLSKVETEKS